MFSVSFPSLRKLESVEQWASGVFSTHSGLACPEQRLDFNQLSVTPMSKKTFPVLKLVSRMAGYKSRCSVCPIVETDHS